MKGIILAAGRGSRMGELTALTPKCKVNLHGRPLIDWQLTALRHAGIEEIAIVRGYLAESFTYPLTYFDNPRWQETNMVVSLQSASAWLETSPCIVSYSDIVYGADSLRRLMRLNADIGITYDPEWQQLWQKRFSNPLEDAETFRIAKDRLLSIGQRAKSLDEIQGQYMGLLKFTPRGWNQVSTYLGFLTQPERDRLSVTELLSNLLEGGIEIQVTPIAEPWYEVDSIDDLATYAQMDPVCA